MRSFRRGSYEYGRLIEQLDKGEVPQVEAAKELGITRNNLKVRLHRARGKLRGELKVKCGARAAPGGLDCTCG